MFSVYLFYLFSSFSRFSGVHQYITGALKFHNDMWAGMGLFTFIVLDTFIYVTYVLCIQQIFLYFVF